MPSVFESMFAASAVPVVLGVHGTALTYLQQGAAARSVNATTSEQERIVEVQGNLMLERSLLVFVSRDAEDGIDDPQLGDGVRRDTDPENYCFAFEGDKDHVLDDSWTLRFVHREPYQVGGNRIA